MPEGLEPRVRGVLGLALLVLFAWLLSTSRRRFPWRVLAWGLGLQIVLGLLFLRWEAGRLALADFSRGVKSFLNLSAAGTRFVFGPLGDPAGPHGFLLAFTVLPTIVFFSSFMALLYHLGLVQPVVSAIAWLMARTMGTSGAESFSGAANIFVGQTEAPLMVRPFLEAMTPSELMAVMTCGFATIAGGVFALYVGFGVDPGHLVIASVMSAPAGLAMAKIMVPETELPATLGRIRLAVPRSSSNPLEAAAAGARDGLGLALNVAAMLVAFLGLIAVADWLLGGLGGWIGTRLSLSRLFSWLFAPFAAALGVAWADVPRIAELLGLKVAANELIAYQALTGPALRQALEPRSVTIATYALCGFANFGSVAIQLGGIGAVAPSRRADLAALAPRALVAGALASWMTAALAGVLL